MQSSKIKRSIKLEAFAIMWQILYRLSFNAYEYFEDGVHLTDASRKLFTDASESEMRKSF